MPMYVSCIIMLNVVRGCAHNVTPTGEESNDNVAWSEEVRKEGRKK